VGKKVHRLAPITTRQYSPRNGEEIRHPKNGGAKSHRSTSSRSTSPIRSDHLQDPCGEAEFLWSRASVAPIFSFIVNGPRPSCARAFRWRRLPCAWVTSTSYCRRTNATAARPAQLLPDLNNRPTNVCRSVPQALWLRIILTSPTRHWNKPRYRVFRIWAEASRSNFDDRMKLTRAWNRNQSSMLLGKVTSSRLPPLLLDVHIAEVNERSLKVLEDSRSRKPSYRSVLQSYQTPTTPSNTLIKDLRPAGVGSSLGKVKRESHCSPCDPVLYAICTWH